MEFKGKLGIYKIIETEDKTKTLWSEYFNEACHNLAGAYEETLYNYINGCEIVAQINSNENMHVLDVGFGLGIGLNALVDTLKNNKLQSKIYTYTSIELDEDLFLWSIAHTFPGHIFTSFHKDGNTTYKSEFQFGLNEKLEVTIYIGDGRLTLKKAHKNNLLPEFTAIFQDAFSPKKNPTLWTKEWFLECKAMASNHVRLATYSSSVSVRKSLIAAGWCILNEKGFGLKRTMTKANLFGETAESLQVELSRSPTLELRDI